MRKCVLLSTASDAFSTGTKQVVKPNKCSLSLLVRGNRHFLDMFVLGCLRINRPRKNVVYVHGASNRTEQALVSGVLSKRRQITSTPGGFKSANDSRLDHKHDHVLNARDRRGRLVLKYASISSVSGSPSGSHSSSHHLPSV